MAWHRLARQRGKSIAEVQASTNAREFAEWCVFESLDPASEARADWRAAMLASTIANAFRGKSQRAFTIKDFIPQFRTKKQQRTDDLEQKVLAWGRMMANRKNRRAAP